MFEVGKYYDIEIRTAEEFSHSRVKVVAWEPPLLKYEIEGGSTTILNTGSPLFYSAKLGPTPEEIAAAKEAWPALRLRSPELE